MLRTLTEFGGSPLAMLEHVAAHPDLVCDLDLERKPGSYARTLLWGDAETSVWAMVWDRGARTAIHDHHCSCAFGIVSGLLTENRFRALDEVRVAKTWETVHRPGAIASLATTQPNIHQMVNDSGAIAISLHIYGFDPRVHDSSVDREYVATGDRP
ncbi:cysteine dioxygenase [Inquilinus sp. OTU3971]|uniref:cysteine dioxygenase n=1 Tax=Inquilinus sp. OTU3971 TaxID=3043855 RepID=UPI00313DD39F